MAESPQSKDDSAQASGSEEAVRQAMQQARQAANRVSDETHTASAAAGSGGEEHDAVAAAFGAPMSEPSLEASSNEAGARAGSGDSAGGIDLLGDVELHVMVELGRTQMLVEDVLKLGEGSVVELDKLAGDPVDVYVNDRLIARGEVLVLNDNFCIRISEILDDLQQEATAAAEQEAQAG